MSPHHTGEGLAMHICCGRQGQPALKSAILVVLLALCSLLLFAHRSRWSASLLEALDYAPARSNSGDHDNSDGDQASALFEASAEYTKRIISNKDDDVDDKRALKIPDSAASGGIKFAAVRRPEAEKEATDRPPSPLRVLFVDKHTEQLGRATRNLARLMTVARAMGRRIAEPFVHESRFYGGEFSRSHADLKNFSLYFDVPSINARLADRGYGEMVGMKTLLETCPSGWHTSLLLLYGDPNMNIPNSAGAEVMRTCGARAQSSPQGWVECPDLVQYTRLLPQQRRARRRRQHDIEPPAQGRGLVVDTARFHDVVEIAKLLADDPCVYLFIWGGEGPNRITLTGITPELEGQRILPYEMTFADDLLSRSTQFQKESLSSKYLAVHIRSESLVKFNGAKRVKDCIGRAAKAIRAYMKETSTPHDKLNIFLLTDLYSNGSDTLARVAEKSDIRELSDFARETIPGRHVYFDGTGLPDKGMVSIVELLIAADALTLVTVGGGNFQEWIVKLRRHQHPAYPAAFRFCMGKPIEGW